MKVPRYKELFTPEEWQGVMSIIHPDSVEQTLGVLHMHKVLLSAAKLALASVKFSKDQGTRIVGYNDLVVFLTEVIKEGEQYVFNPEEPIPTPDAA